MQFNLAREDYVAMQKSQVTILCDHSLIPDECHYDARTSERHNEWPVLHCNTR